MPRKQTFIAADTREPIRGEPIKASEYIPWRDREHLPIRTAAIIVGCSESQIYNLIAQGELERVSLAGRTLIPVGSVLRFVNRAVAAPASEPPRLPRRSSQVPAPRGRRARMGAQP